MTVTDTSTNTVATSATPTLSGTWAADPVHSELAFKVRHMGVGRAGGTFALKSAALTIGAHGIQDGSVTAVIDAATVETKNDARNEHVRSADFLDVESYPTISFRSTGVREFDGETFLLQGELTVRGVTKPVELAAELLGGTVDAYGNDRLGFTATGSINRREFGVNFSAMFGVSNSVVSDKVELTIDVQFTRSES